MFRDFFAGIRDILGGRSGSYEKVLRKGQNEAIGDMMEQARELGANAVVGIDLDYETIQIRGRRLDADGVGLGHRGGGREPAA